MKLKRAVELHTRGDPKEAAALYADILQADPDHPDALHLMGVTQTQLGRPESGLALIAKSLAVNPHQPVAISNQGNAYLALNRPAEALASYDRALRLAPDYPLAVFGRGNALAALGRLDEALASFDRALHLVPRFAAALNARGGVLVKLKRYAEALAAYDASLELSPTLAQAHLGRAGALLGSGEHAQALRSIDRALECKPDYAEAFVERGHVLSELGNTAAAMEAYERAIDCNAALAVAWFSRGLALAIQARHAEAAESLRRTLDIDPKYPYARGARLHAQLQIAEWSDHAASSRAVSEGIERDDWADFPFSFLAVCDSPPLQLKCARQLAALQPAATPLFAGGGSRHDRIRIAYVSADFLEHPTSYLMAGVFERHDRRRFETIGIALREDAQSPTAERVRAAFDRWIPASSQSEETLARLIADLQVDIAVDLMGYTGEHRAGLFAHRPAPLQVSYLGFPATTGSRHIDYIIADEYLIPEERRRDYSECIAYLPECFQANDDRRIAGPDAPTREQAHLPATGFIWCSFHSTYKLNPSLFDIWARLLLAVPGSALWLLGGKPETEDNLRREARRRGVDPERLIFAQGEPYPRHLARLPLANLCLDTYPFNGGATSSDALWAGVPVVTCAGSSYASRMSGSLLSALGLSSLVASSLEEYERLALQLAQDRGRLESTRAALAQRKTVSPLFDTDRFRRHLEAAFIAMVERRRGGLPPASLRVAPIARSS
ncbi:MAG: tetratricopeptide repeat protein [Steroidobacteraceae bacterium]